MTEASGIKSGIVSKEATLWKCPYCSMRVPLLFVFLKVHTKMRTGRQGTVV